SRKPPLILFFSDHGFRYYKKETDRKYQFYNMASVYFRGDTTFKLPDSTSNVNFVRRVFNKAFEQNLPMRKDTFYYIRRFD
ncbi:MAG: Sulfatase, partial [Flaviaesturariibacter sp.]|nr:Sulfatase [Flaviaesturariibacter sp.]